MKASTIQFSFITAVYNCIDLTRSFLHSFEQSVCLSTDSFEIILVDDCSADSIHDLVNEFERLPIRYIRNDENKGFGESNNAGAAAASGEFLILLNNDLLLLPGWFEPISKALESETNGAVGNIQINPRNKLMDHAGVAFDLCGIPFHARKNRKKTPEGAVKEWPAVTAACMGIRRKLFLEMGGFDKIYRNGAEDIDLCMRLQIAGYRNVVCNQSIVYHHVSSSPGRHDFNTHNLQTFLGKWREHSKQIGQEIWATEYIKRYTRHWWKFSPTKLTIAFFRLCMIRGRA